MTRQQRERAIAKLREAEKIVREVVALQNTKMTECPHCRLTKADNLVELRAHESLTAVADRLSNTALAMQDLRDVGRHKFMEAAGGR